MGCCRRGRENRALPSEQFVFPIFVNAFHDSFATVIMRPIYMENIKPSPSPETAPDKNTLAMLLNSGETVESELTLFKRKLKLSDAPVLTLHIITSSLKNYERLLACAASFLDAKRLVPGQATGNLQLDELRQTLSTQPGLTVISDTKTREMVPFAGWLHSQDQIFKGGPFTDEFEKIASTTGSRIILVRFFDSSNNTQLLNALAGNDFLDASLKMTQVGRDT